MKLSLQQQFNDLAKEYDENRRRFIPCFDELYIKSTDFIASAVKSPGIILDLGAGTGLLTSFWLKHFPAAQYVLADVAVEMLDMAQERFRGLNNITFLHKDYFTDFDNLIQSGKRPDTIISALSIHHLENVEKKELFRKIYNALAPGECFVNYDQFCEDDRVMDKLCRDYWENQVLSSGLSKVHIAKWKKRRALDRECSVREELEMLISSGFTHSECIFKSQKFAVLLSIK